MSRHLQALDKALSSILPACRLNLAQSSLFTTVPTEIAAASSKLAGLAFRAAGDVAAGKQPAGNAHDVVERWVTAPARGEGPGSGARRRLRCMPCSLHAPF